MIKNETIFKNIFDNAFEIVCFFDKNGDIFFINEAGRKLLDFSDNEASIRDILPTFFEECDDFLSFVKDNQNGALEGYAYRKNHSCFPASIHFHHESEASKDICIAFISDLRELEVQKKRIHTMEESTKAQIKARDEFTANLTHELRTPVNGIKGHVRNLKETELDISKKRKLDIVLQCCENMETIINNLLDFAKLENGKMVLEEREFSLFKLLESSIAAMQAVAIEKGLDLTCHKSDKVPDLVLGDEFRLSQVINNLLNNAIKFTSAGHVGLDVYLTRQNKREIELTFFVVDTGIGMSEKDKDKLFKSFTQVDGSTTREYGGTGLGLYVCKQIVELMGGNIEVDSQKGRGSTFIFSVNLHVNYDLKEEKLVTISDVKQALSTESENINTAETVIDLRDEHNLKKVKALIENTVLCVELDNWNKAESFANGLKKMLEGTDDSLSKPAFRLVMNVRKEKKEECRKYLDELLQVIESF